MVVVRANFGTVLAFGKIGSPTAIHNKSMSIRSIPSKFMIAATFCSLSVAAAFAQQVQPQKPITPGVEVQPKGFPPDQVEKGRDSFQQNCAFCHGRDGGGGETGPDLTRSKLVNDDANGNLIGPVIHNGRVEKGMPRFNLSDSDIAALIAFIKTQKLRAESQKGGRRGVDIADLQTGNVEAGKRYFEGAGSCSTCHSAAGDLAGIAKKYQGLQLEERMLFPRDAKSRVSVQLPSGEKIEGQLAYLDEFTVAVKDQDGAYRSWPVKRVKYIVDAPFEKHVELLGKYTDDDIHNLMAYLQTLK